MTYTHVDLLGRTPAETDATNENVEQILTRRDGTPITSWRYDATWGDTFARGHLTPEQITTELATWPDGMGGVLDESGGDTQHLWVTFSRHAPNCDDPVDDGLGPCSCTENAEHGVFDLGRTETYQWTVAGGTPGAIPVTLFWVTWP